MKSKLTIGDKFALIIAAFLPRRVKYYAMLDWMDWLPVDTFIVESPRYRCHFKKVLK